MARRARSQAFADSLETGQLYHVTNRGVDRCDLFHSDLDRIVFLSMLAECCSASGAICHAWCLMTNHFHLVLEDPRGLLSQALHGLQFAYARYFNDTRRRKRVGPLFSGRFRAELIDSSAYFQDAVAYVLLNPVRTTVPMAVSAEDYRWSSAALVCAETSATAFCTALLDTIGGLEAILATLPRSRFRSCNERRRARLHALAAGDWLSRDLVLSGRPAELYAVTLRTRAMALTVSDATTVVRLSRDMSATNGAAGSTESLQPIFRGLDVNDAVSTVEKTCSRLVPMGNGDDGDRRLARIVGYALWRLTSATADRISSAVNMAVEEFEVALRSLRNLRATDDAWRRLLWSIEWSLRWRLRAAPCRI